MVQQIYCNVNYKLWSISLWNHIDSTVNSILDDIARKYKINTSKEHLSEDIHVQEVKFKYRTYGECIRILYKNVGYMQKA
jgi:hypothetical protein